MRTKRRHRVIANTETHLIARTHLKYVFACGASAASKDIVEIGDAENGTFTCMTCFVERRKTQSVYVPMGFFSTKKSYVFRVEQRFARVARWEKR